MNRLLLALLTLVTLSSCSKKLTSFTEQLYDNQRWSDSDLKNIQFYLSDDIVLRRDAGTSRSALSRGKIIIENGRRIEQVVFKKNTPGVFVRMAGRDKFAMSFENGNDKYLIFGPSKKQNGRFVLLAKDWKRDFGKVTYGGEVWETGSVSAYAYLQVDIDRATSVKYQTKKVKGRRVK